MGYPLRRFEAGCLYETTSRTIHGRLLLRPSRELNSMIRGILARAVARYRVEVCYFVVMSNHMHLLVVPDSAQQMSLFMNYVNGNIAKEAGRLHGWRECVWGRRYRPIRVSDEPEAQIARLRYLLAHGCKEGLVRKPSEWPGASGLQALLTGHSVVGLWFDRTGAYRARRSGEEVGPADFATEESFDLVPLPCWSLFSARERQSAVVAMVCRIEQETRDRLGLENRSPMGPRRVLRQHPHDQPQRSKRSPAPLVHAATLEAWIRYKEEWLEFVGIYRKAANRLLRGELHTIFPTGSIPPRLPYSRARPSPE